SYAGNFDAYQPNPLTNATASNRHSTLGGASAIELDDAHLLTWDPTEPSATRDYRLWKLHYNTSGEALEDLGKQRIPDLKGEPSIPLPHRPLLDSPPGHNSTVFEYQLDPSKPLITTVVTSYNFSTIVAGHRLVRLTSSRVLEMWFEAGSNPERDR